MDPEQFDDAVCAVFAGQNRRRLLGRLVAAVLAAVGLAAASDVTQARKRKKRCRGCPVCKKCVRGRCRPVPNFTPCGGVCQECQGGQCANRPDDSACLEDGRCLTGDCKEQPTCVSFNVGGCTSLGDAACCSGECDETPPGGVCTKGAPGRPCRVAADCTSNSCIGYVCG